MQIKREGMQHPLHQAPKLSVEGYFQILSHVIPRLPYAIIDQIIATLLQAYEESRTVYIFGNGGSAATASHMTCELNKGITEKLGCKRLKVMALTDNVALLTAWANDVNYEHAFSEQLRTFVQPRDVAFAISGSGNSPNVLRALNTARESGATTIGVTGYQGGKMKALCDICAVVPSDNMQIIEDMHHAIAHSIYTIVRQTLCSREQARLVAD